MSKRYRIFILLVIGIFLLGKSDAFSASKKKFEIKSVQFKGNHAFSSDQLRNVMISRPSSFFHNSYYHAPVLEQDLKNLQLFYQQHGYLQAEITSHKVEIDTSRSQVHIYISVSEGSLTHVDGVSVFGNKFFPDEQLAKMIKIHTGDPLEAPKIESATVSILTMYRNNGFLNAEVTPDVGVNDTTHTAIIDFLIVEKIQYTIDKIRIEGLDDIKPYVVGRELKFHEGEVVYYSKLLQSQQNLYLTGLFQSVYIQPKPASNGDSTQKDILIQLKEIIPGDFLVSVGYGTIEKLRGRIQTRYTNFRGAAQQIGATVGASFINREIQGSFADPWTFNTRFSTNINGKWEYLSQPGYDVHQVGGQLTVSRKFLKISNVSLTYNLQRSSLSNVSTTELPANLINNVSSLIFAGTYDTRNDLFNPTRGIYSQISNEFAGYYFSGSVAFYRLIGEFKYFHSWTPNTILAMGLLMGRIDPAKEFASLPLNERFYTGGPNSLRGYDYQKVGPLDAGNSPVGGELKLVWHIFEVRQTIYKMFGAAIFADAGNVWKLPRNFKLGGIRYDAGVGLRVNTPIGLVRLDYAFKMNRRPGESIGKLYFGMGQAF